MVSWWQKIAAITMAATVNAVKAATCLYPKIWTPLQYVSGIIECMYQMLCSALSVAVEK